MTPTLPTPGGNLNVWGGMVNEWIESFRDSETIVFDQHYDRSATPATNRVNLQTLLDRIAPGGSGKQVRLFIPPKWDSGNPDPIVVDSNGVDAWCLNVPSNVSIEGAGRGTTLKTADGEANFYGRIFRVWGKENVAIRNLRLDGNKANNNPLYEQSHNIIVWESTDVLVEDVETVDATGDGIIIGGTSVISQRVHLNRIKGSGNLRNPVTVNEAADVWINESDLTVPSGSGGQAIDSEPDDLDGYDNLWIANCKLKHEDADGYALSTGGKAGYPRRNVHVIGTEFDGSIYIYENDGLWFDRCFGTMDHIEAIGASNRVTLRDTQFAFGSTAQGLNLKHSSGLGTPTNWALIDNDWTITTAGAAVCAVWGADGFTMRGGRYIGTGGVYDVGVDLHATRSMKDIVIDGPYFEGLRYGVLAYKDDSNTITNLRAWGRFKDISEMSLQLAPGYEFINNLVLPPSLEESSAGGVNVGNGTPYVLAGTPGRGATWNCYGDPEGAITEIVGAVALRRDGGSGTTMYVKESGTGNTGWAAV